MDTAYLSPTRLKAAKLSSSDRILTYSESRRTVRVHCTILCIWFFTCFDVVNKLIDGFKFHLLAYPNEEKITQRRRSRESLSFAENTEGGTGVATVQENISIFDPSIRGDLNLYVKKAIGLEVFLSIVFLVLLLLTYGNTWDPTDKYSNIKIAVLNNDDAGGIIGKTVNTLTTSFHPSLSFGLDVLPAYSKTYEDMVRDVNDGKWWAAIVVHNNSTSNLCAHLYDPSAAAIADYKNGVGAMSFIMVGGRGGSLIQNLLKLWTHNGRRQRIMRAPLA